MPGPGRSIVVGGGIAAGTIVIGEYLFVTSASPPTASSSPRLRISTGQIIAESAAGRGNTVIGPNTASTQTVNSSEVLIGNTITSAVTALNANNVGIGVNIGFTGASTSNVIIGDQLAGIFPAAGVTGGSNVHVGRVSSVGGSFKNSATSLGHGVTVGGSNSVIIGTSASVSGNNAVAVGDSSSAVGASVAVGQAAAAPTRSVVLGQGSQGTGTASDLIFLGPNITLANLTNFIAIGTGVSFAGLASGDIIIGNNNLSGGGFSSRLIWGGANQHSSGVAVPAWTTRWKNASGTDIAAGSVTFIGPLATGNAASGSFIWQTGVVGASGTAVQAAATRLTIAPGGLITMAAPAAGVTLTVDGVGGAATPSIRLNGLTTGAAAAVGTLNNAPTAGDPAFWIPVNIAGAVRYIPAWP